MLPSPAQIIFMESGHCRRVKGNQQSKAMLRLSKATETRNTKNRTQYERKINFRFRNNSKAIQKRDPKPGLSSDQSQKEQMNKSHGCVRETGKGKRCHYPVRQRDKIFAQEWHSVDKIRFENERMPGNEQGTRLSQLSNRRDRARRTRQGPSWNRS